MSQPVRQRWTVDAFFAWQERQGECYELVDGQPVPAFHRGRERRNLSRPDQAAGCRGRLRPLRPDRLHGCRTTGRHRGPVSLDARLRGVRKLGEYKAVGTIVHILLVEPNAPEVALWSRDGEGGWESTRIQGLDASVPLPGISASLPLSDIYDGIAFPAGPPRPVSDE